MSAKDSPRLKWFVEPTFDEDGVQRSSGLASDGKEYPDPVPMHPPLGLNVEKGDETHAILKRMFGIERAKMRMLVEDQNFENEDEANDFLVPDELFPPGNEPWEDVFNFPAEEPGSVTNGPSLASAPVKGESPQQDGAPPVTPSQRSSGGFGPDVTPGTPPAQTPRPGVIGDDNRTVGQGSASTSR